MFQKLKPESVEEVKTKYLSTLRRVNKLIKLFSGNYIRKADEVINNDEVKEEGKGHLLLNNPNLNIKYMKNYLYILSKKLLKELLIKQSLCKEKRITKRTKCNLKNVKRNTELRIENKENKGETSQIECKVGICFFNY